MKRQSLGDLLPPVSQLALGTVEIGLDYGIPADAGYNKPTEAEAIRFLNQAVDAGVNFIDTARAYGASEELIGKALSGRRPELVLATKLTPVPTSAWADERRLLARARESLGESLRLLKTDHVDLLMLHSAPLELIRRGGVLLSLLRDLQAEGLTRSVGASVYQDAGPEAAECGAFDVIQIGYNALDRSPEQATLTLARRAGVGVVARSVLLKGVLTPRHSVLPLELLPLREAALRLQGLAAEAGMSLVELAYRYVLSKDVVALCGTARFGELAEVIGYVSRGGLPEDLLARVREITVSDQALLNPANWPF